MRTLLAAGSLLALATSYAVPSGAAGAAAVAGDPERRAPAAALRAPQVVAADAPKTAVLGSAGDRVGEPFTVVDADGDSVLSGQLEEVPGDTGPWAHAALADFSDLEAPGTYRVVAGAVESGPVVVEADPYPDLLASLLGVYDANADGAEPSTYHGPSHLHDRTSKIRNGPHRGDRVDVRGGWMDSGDQLKFTVTIGYAATLLQLAARVAPAEAATLEEVADVGVRFLRRAHPRKGVFVAQVGDTEADHNAGFRDPTVDDGSDDPLRAHRPSSVLTRKTGGADVAGVAAAALALAAQRATGQQRKGLVRAAKDWYAEALDLGKPWRNCCYGQDTWRDDVAAAAVELWRATGDATYRKAAVRHLVAVTGDGDQSWRIGFDGYELAGLPAAELCGQLGLPAASGAAGTTGCRLLRVGGDGATWRGQQDAFGRAGAMDWGSVRNSQNGALVALLAGRAGLDGARRTAHRALGWFLGANPWGVRFQAGFGVEHPYHWAQLDGPREPAGAVVGGPAPRATVESQFGTIDLGPHDTDAAVYRDVGGDWVTNEVGIPYSAGSVLLAALLAGG